MQEIVATPADASRGSRCIARLIALIRLTEARTAERAWMTATVLSTRATRQQIVARFKFCW
jgi:hypothetical protein